MAKEELSEKLKLMHEAAAKKHEYFLDWRYKLFAGYIAVIAALAYFLVTADLTVIAYDWICRLGIVLTILFGIINHRNTELTWKAQNCAYLIEKKMGFTHELEVGENGIYSSLISKAVREDLEKIEKEKAEKGKAEKGKSRWIRWFNPLYHTGALNMTFILVIGLFLVLECKRVEIITDDSKDKSEAGCKCVNSK